MDEDAGSVFYVTARGASARSFLMRHLEVLAENGYKPYLLCSKDAEAADVVSRTGVPHLDLALRVDIALVADIKALIQLLRYIAKKKPLVVHGHMSKAGFASMLAAWILRVPVRVYHNHGMACFSAIGMRRYLLEVIEKISCRCATDVLFCSESTRAEAIALGLCHEKKSMVLGGGTISGVKLEKFSPQQAEIQARKLAGELGLKTGSENNSVVIFVGRIVAHKGIDTLIQAWQLLNEDVRKQSILILAGAHADDALYARLAKLVQSDPSVKYIGRIDNIVGLYGLANILVLPSWHEGFPYSVLEAQACGLPAIVTRVTGNVDAVVDGITGMIVEKNDANELASTIELLLASPDQLARLGQQATQRVVDHYRETVVLNNLLSFYKQRVPL